MNTKVIAAIVVLVLLLGGGALLLSQNKTAPATQTETPTQAVTAAPTHEDMSGMDANDSMSPTTGPSGAVEGDTTSAGNVKEFTVEGSPYKFVPNTLTVNKGDTVRIIFKNSGGMHDFVIDEFNVKTDIIQGGATDTVEFVANKAGTFEYYCSVGNHRQMGMVGTLTVK